MVNISSALNTILTSKDQVPIFQVQVFDTPLTVPSVGLSGYYYNNSNFTKIAGGQSADTPYWAQNDGMMLFSWDNGVPIPYGINLSLGNQYSIQWKGQFYAAKDGNYKFTYSAGAGNDFTGSPPSASTTISVAGNPILNNQPVNLMKGSWNAITLRFAKAAGSDDGSVAFFYSEPDDVPNAWRLLSANVLSPNTSFVAATIISGIESVEIEMDKTQANQATFVLADIATSSAYAWSDTTQSFGPLKPNRLVKILTGYLTSNGEELIQQFIGHIDSVQPKQEGSKISLNVTCRDFSKQLMETIVAGFPNKGSYLLPMSMTSQVKAFKVPAYDRWLLKDAVIDLCLHANIDPSYLITKIDQRMGYRLEWNTDAYPLDYVSSSDPGKTDKFISRPFLFRPPFGDPIWQHVLKFSDLVGFTFYFDRQGNLVWRDPRNEYRIEHYEDIVPNSFVGSTSKLVTTRGPVSWIRDAQALTGSYRLLNPNTNSNYAQMSFYFEGIGCSVFVITSSGSDTMANWSIWNQTTASFIGGTIDTSSATTVYQKEIQITKSLPYGKYRFSIFPSSPSAKVSVEGIKVFGQDVDTPVYTFKDTNEILSLGFTQDNQNIRNDVIVVGTPPVGSVSSVGNPAPPYGRASDLNSIANPNSTNYVGRQNTFVLNLPTVSDVGQLQWMAQKILSRYSLRHRFFNFETAAVPHLEFNDPVGLQASALNINTTTKNTTFSDTSLDLSWIETMKHSLKKSEYKTPFTVSTYPPMNAWRPSLSSPIVITTPIPQDPYWGIDSPIENVTPVQFSSSLVPTYISSVTVSPTTFDPTTLGGVGATANAVTVSVSLLTSFQNLFCEIYFQNGGSLVQQLKAGGGAGTSEQIAGVTTFIWDLTQVGQNYPPPDGTYDIYVYGQISDNMGTVYPSVTELWPSSDGQRGKPWNAMIFKKADETFPTIALSSSPADVGFLMAWSW